MKATCIIPARYASTRLPGKPLLAETGKPLIQHVVESVSRAERIGRVIVATDDGRIVQAVEGFGGEAIMTSPDHTCGTERLAEAAATLALRDEEIVVNVQGDEPDIPPACVELLVELLGSCDAPMATLAAPLPADQVQDPNKVKVVLGTDGTALYFSRAAIPYDRDGSRRLDYLLHLGVYAYRAGFLKLLASLRPSPAEQAERLEQLRALENGYKIAVALVEYRGTGIDTPEDYAAFVAAVGKART